MSLKRKLFSVFSAAAVTVVFGAFAMAQDATVANPTTDKEKSHRQHGEFGGKFGGRHGGGRRGGGMMRMMHGLNLTDAQKTQIHSIMEANKPTGENRDQMKAIMEAKRAGTITPEQQAQAKAFRQAQRAKMQSIHEQILAVLTPEQKAQIETRKQEMKQHMQDRKQRWEQKKSGAAAQPGATKDN